jgi:dynein heavy chain
MPSLEKLCEGFEESTMIHKDFRLFLTSMPADYFPVPILQNGVKLTIEPPKGLRANVLRSLNTTTDEILGSSPKEVEWRRLQFGLKFFHAIVQERRKFGPLGWNIRYEFNDSDLETSTTITKNMLDIDGDIPWDTLLFVIGHINYGGRVTDDKDRRLILAILEQYVSPQLLDPSYEFSNSGNYKCPPNSDTATTEGFIEFVKGFPLTEAPEVFGMHDNANISFMQQESDKLIGVVLSIQPRESGSGGGKSSEEIVVEIAADQSSRLPEKLTQASTIVSGVLTRKSLVTTDLPTPVSPVIKTL